MLPDYEVLLLRDVPIIIFPSQVHQQIFEAPNVASSHQLIRSHRQTDEQDEAEPRVKQTKEQAVPLPAQYHSQHIRCHDAKSNLENFSKADDIFVSSSSHLAIKQGSDHPFVARSHSFRDIDRGQRIGESAGEADEEDAGEKSSENGDTCREEDEEPSETGENRAEEKT